MTADSWGPFHMAQLAWLTWLLATSLAQALDQPPEFLPADAAGVNPQEIWIPERSRLNLKCPIKERASLGWLKDGEVLMGENAQFLDVPTVSRTDSGVYQCVASNEFGSVISWAMNLTVTFFDGFDGDQETSTWLVKNTRSFVIKPPRIKSNKVVGLSWRWFAGDDEITSDQNFYITYTGSLIALNPPPTTIKYTVQVRDMNSPVFMHHFLVKQDDSVLSTTSPEVAILFVPRDQQLVFGRSHPVSLHQDQGPGDAAVFECVASEFGRLQPDIKWFINGDLIIPETNGVHVEKAGRRLVIYQSARPDGEHEAQVKCVATSSDGIHKDSATAKLEFFESPKIGEFEEFHGVNKGNRLRLRCPIEAGWPRPRVSWYHDGKKVSALQNEASTSQVANLHASLEVEAVALKDYGVYQCEARNTFGLDTKAVWVHQVDDKMFARQADSMSVPEIVEKPLDVVVRPGHDALFNCKPGDPHNSQVSWLFNGTPLALSTNPRLRSNLSSLVIQDVHAADQGVYTCQVSSEVGQSARASAELTVAGTQLIQLGPSNQSALIGTNIKMPCVVSEEVARSARPIWSKNGRVIPAKGDPLHRISIDEDGQLTINQVAPDNIGIYRCTVKVGQDEESMDASLQIIEKPGMPHAVTAELSNDTMPAKMRVSWRPGFDGNSPIIKHAVEMRVVGASGLWNDWEPVVESVPAAACCAALVDNLRPSATAEFRVLAFNRHGPGRPSLPSANVTMPQQPPAASPRAVAASARTANAVMVQWQPPPPDQWNGDILGYSLRYRLAGYDLPWMEKRVGKPDARNAVLDQLITWRTYEVQVAAFNDRGLGVYSKPIDAQSLEGTPMVAPQNVAVTVLSSTEVEVQFDPLDQQMVPGVNLGYKIEFWKGEVGGRKFRMVNIDPDSSRLMTRVQNLEKFGHYNLTVVCLTSVGDGPRSDALEVITEEDVPGPVSAVSFDQVQFSSVLVVWEPPAEPNGVLIKYILRYWETAQPDQKQTVEVNSLDRNATIEGLTASTQYSVDIQALTKVGASPRTEAKFESGVPPELPGRPSALTVSDIGPRSVSLQFIPGFDGHSYIKKWIVEAKVGSSTVFTEVYNVSAPKARSITVESLRPFTRYQIRLIAENIRGRGAPSEPSRVFETQATEPETPPDKVYAEPVADDRIQVVWSPLHNTHWNGEPRGYVVYYRALKPVTLGGPSKSESSRTPWLEMRTANHKAGDLTLSDLQPYTTYQVKVAAENGFGVSQESEVVTAVTYESAPAAGPESVSADIHQQSVRVQWDEVPQQFRRGQIEGYRVRLVPEEQQLRTLHTKEELVRTADSRAIHFLASKLRPFTAYRVFVSAFNLIGEGPHSSQTPVITTAADIPGPPTHVKFGKVSNQSLVLTWSQPEDANGVVTNYLLRHWREDRGEESAVATVLPHNIYQFSAASLTPDSNYMFGIKAQSAIGVSTEVRLPVRTSASQTRLPTPPTPQPTKQNAPSKNGLWLTWDKVDRMQSANEAPVREVQVEYQRTNQQGWTRLRRTVLPHESKVQLTGLIPNVPYRARIRFVGDFQEGVWSPESDWAKTLESEPEYPPNNVRAKPYESSSIMLEWSGLDPLHWNSDRIGYKILYRVYPSNSTFSVETLPLIERNPEDGKFKHVIHKLSSFHHYIVQVQAYNNIGTSLPSKPPVFVYVGFSIPKQEVKGLKAEAASSTSVQVTWDAWKNDNDDVISGYKVRYAPILDGLSPEVEGEAAGEPSSEDVVVTEDNRVLLTDLRKFTEYQITVSGYNRAGEGQSSAVRVLTLEDLPGPVGQLQFSDILLESVNVSWSAPAQPNGKVLAYSVTYRTYRMSEEFRKEIQEKTPFNFLLANDLEVNTTYSFMVQALTSLGAGVPVAGNVTIGYNRGGPGAPTRPMVLPEQSSFLMKWTDGPSGATPIKGYIIQAKRTGVAQEANQTRAADKNLQRRRRFTDPYRPQHVIGEWVTISNVLGVENEYRISYKQLEPSSYYVFRVFARNDLGVGLPSPTSEQLHVPASIPEDPFYTKWWFLVIVSLVIVIIVILFISVLCFVNSTTWKSDDKGNAFDTHQLADGFVVSYGLADKHRSEENVRPGTHTSWLSNENLRNNEHQYGSMVSGINQNRNNPYSTSSVYQALATDTVPDTHRNGKPAKTVNHYASKSQLNLSQPAVNNYWVRAPVQVDVSPYGARIVKESERLHDEDDAEMQAERSFAGHYQTNPQEETYRQTWRRTREQAERQRAQSGRGLAGPSPVYLTPNRPDSEATSETGRSGSDEPNPGPPNHDPAAHHPGIQLRADFSPKTPTYASTQHGFSSFV